MDVTRSCYIGKMRFRDSDNPVSVKWFFADERAAVFDSPTIFRGADFEQTPYENSGLGTQRPPRGSYYNGKPIAGLTGESRSEHWPLSWWLEGIPDGQTVLVPRSPSGVPLACIPDAMGIFFGGSAIVGAPPSPVDAGGLLLGGTAQVGTGLLSPGGVLLGGDALVSSGP